MTPLLVNSIYIYNDLVRQRWGTLECLHSLPLCWVLVALCVHYIGIPFDRISTHSDIRHVVCLPNCPPKGYLSSTYMYFLYKIHYVCFMSTRLSFCLCRINQKTLNINTIKFARKKCSPRASIKPTMPRGAPINSYK